MRQARLLLESHFAFFTRCACGKRRGTSIIRYKCGKVTLLPRPDSFSMSLFVFPSTSKCIFKHSVSAGTRFIGRRSPWVPSSYTREHESRDKSPPPGATLHILDFSFPKKYLFILAKKRGCLELCIVSHLRGVRSRSPPPISRGRRIDRIPSIMEMRERERICPNLAPHEKCHFVSSR